YYNSLGAEIPDKKLRASFCRPSLGQVLAFRAHVDREMERFLAGLVEEESVRIILLGLNHEQQHQELVLTDIKHAFFCNPLRPLYAEDALSEEKERPLSKLSWQSLKGGLIEIGYPVQAANPLDFCFDNETPRHKVYLEPFQIANRMVTCREYLEFISDDAYTRPEFWLSEGWETLKQTGWTAPLYWDRDFNDQTGLEGLHPTRLARTFCTAGFARLPHQFLRGRCVCSLARVPASNEAEWECVASQVPPQGNLLD